MTDTYVHIRESSDLSFSRPQFVYEAPCPIHSSPEARVVCQVTSNVNESQVWCDRANGGDCPDQQLWTALKKCWAAMGTRFAAVWQDTGVPNLSTGRVESDPKKFRQHLARKSEEMAERLGMPVDYQPADPSDTFLSDEGLDDTHDRAVGEGRKDSRGRFVWQM